jgi:uncharacterized protein (TIGR03000 family)
MRNRILLGTILGALAMLALAESAQAQFYVRGGRGGFSAGYGYGPSYGYGYYGPAYGYRGSGWSVYYGPSYGYYYGGYPYRSYYYSPYVYSYPRSYYWDEPVYSGSYLYAVPSQPAPSMAEARLNVTVPTPNTQLWIENVPMPQLGMERTFATPPLEAGKTYTYHLRARWTDGDREVSRERSVTVRAGEATSVNFRDVASNVP